MFRKLLKKDYYFFEIQKILKKARTDSKLLNKVGITKELSLRWVLFNKNFVIKNIIKTLKKGLYTNPTAKEIILKVNDKERLLYSFDWHEKLLQSVVANILSTHFENFYSDGLNSYRKGRGSYSTLKDLVLFLAQIKDENIYLVKTDISSYGDSIKHEILFDVLNYYIKDDNFLNILKKIIKFNYIEALTNEIKIKEIGLPTGSPVNNVLTNIFLSDLDYEITKNISYGKYYRYGDDIFFVSTNVNEFNFVKNKILDTVSKKELAINEDKFDEYICEVTDKSILIIKYLGFNIDFNNMLITLTKEKDLEIKDAIITVFKRIVLNTRFENYSEKKKLKILIINFKKYFSKTDIYSQILTYFGVVNDESYWKNLDLWIAQTTVSKAYNIPKRKAFKKVTYKKLRELGLFSLVHTKRIHSQKNKNKLSKYLK